MQNMQNTAELMNTTDFFGPGPRLVHAGFHSAIQHGCIAARGLPAEPSEMTHKQSKLKTKPLIDSPEAIPIHNKTVNMHKTLLPQ